MPSIFDLGSPGAPAGGHMIAKPARPGTVIEFTGQQAPRILPSAGDVVAIPIIHDWGPLGTDSPFPDPLAGGPQLCLSFAEFTSRYGDSDTPGRTAVAGAFAGEGLPGSPGAGGVIVFRMGTAAAAQASVQIHAVGAGAATLTLTAKYKGVRGNRIGYTVDNDPNNSAQDRIRIYFDGVLRETYFYLAPNLATVVATINARSALVSATADVLDTAPALRLAQALTPVSLAGGLDGTPVTSVEHLAALQGLQFLSFGVIAPYDVTDSAIQASYVSFVQTQSQASRPSRLVLGGAAGEDITAAMARSGTINDEHVINFGCGTYHDDLLGKDLSTSQLASRIAGIVAARGLSRSLTFADIGGLHAIIAPSDDEIEAALSAGVVVLTPSGSPDADLHIEKGVTTYTSDTATKPLDVYGDERLIGVMDDYVRQMKQWGDRIVIGGLPVNDDTRALVRGQARAIQDAYQTQGLILPGNAAAVPPIPAPYVVVEDPGDPTLEDAVPYTFGWQFAKTANAILGEGTVR